MAETASTMIPLGTIAPAFNLFDTVSGKNLSLQELKSDVATVIMFLCNHCPYVKHIQTKIVEIANFYQTKNIRFIAISSNDTIAYPQDGPDAMHEEAKNHHYPFPYLFDETQAVAKAYLAACTPDFFVFDHNLKCIYRGRFDAATPGNKQPVTGEILREVLENVLAHKPITIEQIPSLGCNIKWKK